MQKRIVWGSISEAFLNTPVAIGFIKTPLAFRAYHRAQLAVLRSINAVKSKQTD